MPKCRALNFRMVRVTPFTLQGGMTAATRLPSGRRESRMGFDSEMSSPQAPGDILHGDHQGFLAEIHTLNRLDESGPFKDAVRTVDHDLADRVIEDQMLDRLEKRQDGFKSVHYSSPSAS